MSTNDETCAFEPAPSQSHVREGRVIRDPDSRWKCSRMMARC